MRRLFHTKAPPVFLNFARPNVPLYIVFQYYFGTGGPTFITGYES
jgi:hypothetical protein